MKTKGVSECKWMTETAVNKNIHSDLYFYLCLYFHLYSTLYKPVHPGEGDSCCLLCLLDTGGRPPQRCLANPLQD